MLLSLVSYIIQLLTRQCHEENKRQGWTYIGSHNFSQAAWGRLQKNASQLHISNYEIGVLIMRPSQNLPFVVPPAHYTQNDEPWIYEKHSKPSKCGNCNSIMTKCSNQHQLCSSCFKCSVCNVNLTNYYAVEGKLYCAQHYEAKPFSKCARCKVAIVGGTKFKKALDQLWHMECFTCDFCQKQIAGEFVEFQSNPVCPTCAYLVFQE